MSGKPWFREDPELRRHVQDVAQELQPELFWEVEDQTAFLRGTFHVLREGSVVDRYEVEVEFPHNYPEERPIVRETDERIPCVPDRHVFKSGRACLFLDDEYEYRYPGGMSFRDFLDGAMMSYFLCQSYYELEGEWPLDDRGHHFKGVIEFYSEIVGTDNVGVIYNYLDYIERGAKGHWDCPCGSGNRVRDCHQELMWRLKDRISEESARRSKKRLLEAAAAFQARKEEGEREHTNGADTEHV